MYPVVIFPWEVGGREWSGYIVIVIKGKSMIDIDCVTLYGVHLFILIACVVL